MPQGIKVDNPQSYARIEAICRHVRSVLVPGLAVTDALPGVDLFERLEEFLVDVGGKKIPLSYGVKNLPEGVEGETRYESKRNRIVVNLSESTYAGLERRDPRARFSAVHEIGHAVLHPAELVRLAEIPHSESPFLRDAKRDHKPFVDSEWQANSFAAALLMPAAGIAALEAKYGPSWVTHASAVFVTSILATDIRAEVYRKRRTELL